MNEWMNEEMKTDNNVFFIVNFSILFLCTVYYGMFWLNKNQVCETVETECSERTGHKVRY